MVSWWWLLTLRRLEDRRKQKLENVEVGLISDLSRSSGESREHIYRPYRLVSCMTC